MNEQLARRVVLVRAIESADTDYTVLSEDDRKYASRSARELAAWQAADSKAAPNPEHFFQQRAEQILKRLAERSAAFASFQRRSLGLPGLWLALPVLALFAGALLDRVADPHRVDLLSAPLLLILAWNALMLALLLVWAVVPGARKTGWAGPGLLRLLSVGKAALPRKLPAALANGVAQFMAEWPVLSAPLTRARLARSVHLSAAAFALGAVLSLYARGLLTRYGAGWESTFLDAGQVHALLSWLFAPVLFLIPALQGFSLAEIEALRFGGSAVATGGARWVHLYGATIVLFVVLPRLLLAGLAGWRAARLKRHFPLPLAHPYFQRLADSIGAGSPAVLRVLPYSFTLDDARDRGLWTVAAMALGAQARVLLRPVTAYGEAPQPLGRAGADEGVVSVTAALFSLAATPEAENHGAFLDYLLSSNKEGVAVLLDESALTERGAGQAGLAARIDARIALWRQFCSFHGAAATVVNLLEPDKRPFELGAGLALPALR